jgi:hypothetical protein
VCAAENQALPGIWRTTIDALYELTNLVAGEPVIEVL